jgi:hypothetical protein
MDAASAGAHVRAYIEAWRAAWAEAKERMGDDVDFDVWRARIDAVDARFFGLRWVVRHAAHP